MKNEYLFLTDEYWVTVEGYRPEGITVEISGIENTPLWVVTFFLPSKNEDSAKILSEVHTTIMQYSPLVLSCESSEYYNRILFPLINELERKLRKLLYLAASISANGKAKENIKQLEEKEFGELFELLFIDQNFIHKLRTRVNADGKSEYSGMSKYSKDEIKLFLDLLKENTLWDMILGKKDVPTLRSRFEDVRKYRNEVMHAHNIGRDIFGKARYLFDKINMELDIAIGKLIGVSEERNEEQKPEVNTAISSALVAMDLSAISEVFDGASRSPAALEMSSQISKALEGLRPLGASTVLEESLKGLTSQINNLAITDEIKGMNAIVINPAIADALKPFQSLKEISAFAEALRSTSAFQSSPAIDNIRRQVSQLSELMWPYRQINDIIKQNNAQQEPFSSTTENLPRNLSVDDITDDITGKEPMIDNEIAEEDNPNE